MFKHFKGQLKDDVSWAKTILYNVILVFRIHILGWWKHPSIVLANIQILGRDLRYFLLYSNLSGKLHDPTIVFIVLNWVAKKGPPNSTKRLYYRAIVGQRLPCYSQLIGCHNAGSATKNLMDTCWATARTNRYYIYCHSQMLRCMENI